MSVGISPQKWGFIPSHPFMYKNTPPVVSLHAGSGLSDLRAESGWAMVTETVDILAAQPLW